MQLGRESDASFEVYVGALAAGTGVRLEHGVERVRIGEREDRCEVFGGVRDGGSFPCVDGCHRVVREDVWPFEAAVGHAGCEPPEGHLLQCAFPPGQQPGRYVAGARGPVEGHQPAGAVGVRVVGGQPGFLDYLGVDVVQAGERDSDAAGQIRSGVQLAPDGRRTLQHRVHADGGALEGRCGARDLRDRERNPAGQQAQQAGRRFQCSARGGVEGSAYDPGFLGFVSDQGILVLGTDKGRQRLDAHGAQTRSRSVGQGSEGEGGAQHVPHGMPNAGRSLGPVPATPSSLSDLVLSRTTLDRAGHRRADVDLFTNLLASSDTRIIDLYGDSAVVRNEYLVLRAPEPADADRFAVFLGVDRGTDIVALDRPGEEPPADALSLRGAGMDLNVHDVGIFTTALGILNWQRTQGFCPLCGAPAEVVDAGWGRRCTNDGTNQYPRTDAAVIMAVIDQDDRLLLARGVRFGAETKRMSVLAGFVEPGESLENAVAREVLEEVGVTVSQVQFKGDQPWPFPASLMVGFVARASTTDLVLQAEEIADARWFSRAELATALQDGSIGVPPGLSIARHLIEDWFGGPLPEAAGGQW